MSGSLLLWHSHISHVWHCNWSTGLSASSNWCWLSVLFIMVSLHAGFWSTGWIPCFCFGSLLFKAPQSIPGTYHGCGVSGVLGLGWRMDCKYAHPRDYQLMGWGGWWLFSTWSHPCQTRGDHLFLPAFKYKTLVRALCWLVTILSRCRELQPKPDSGTAGYVVVMCIRWRKTPQTWTYCLFVVSFLWVLDVAELSVGVVFSFWCLADTAIIYVCPKYSLTNRLGRVCHCQDMFVWWFGERSQSECLHYAWLLSGSYTMASVLLYGFWSFAGHLAFPHCFSFVIKVWKSHDAHSHVVVTCLRVCWCVWDVHPVMIHTCFVIIVNCFEVCFWCPLVTCLLEVCALPHPVSDWDVQISRILYRKGVKQPCSACIVNLTCEGTGWNRKISEMRIWPFSWSTNESTPHNQ